MDEARQGVEYAHARGVSVLLALYVCPQPAIAIPQFMLPMPGIVLLIDSVEGYRVYASLNR